MRHKNISFPIIKTICCAGKTIDFSLPRIMGILNLTPDSFYDGGRYQNKKHWVTQTAQMLEEGADIIDLGAVSTRPGTKLVNIEEELQRILPPVKILIKEFPDAIFSIDTFRSEVARATIGEGAHIINDISGGKFDPAMLKTIASLKVPYVLMHMHGTPETMQTNPVKKNIVTEVRSYFQQLMKKLKHVGVQHIILDPGFGFGKTMECNYQLLKHLEEIRVDDFPVLAGISRKSLVNKILKTNPDQALNGTTVLHTLALLGGANILRVHDVKAAFETVALVKYYREVADRDDQK